MSLKIADKAFTLTGKEMIRFSITLKNALLLAVLLLPACQSEPNDSADTASGTPLGLYAQAPIVREPVAGRDITVAYMTIQNKGNENRVLLGASSSYAARIEIHEHQHSEGRMRMVKRSSLPLAANSDTVLESGGTHLMLFELKRDYSIRSSENAPAQAQTVELTLMFDKDETLTLSTQLSSVLN